MAAEKWFSRRFELGLEPGAQPGLTARLRGTPERLAAAVEGLSPERMVRRPPGGWSIVEQVGHLSDLEPLWLGRVDDLLAGETRLRAADLENKATWAANHNARPIHDVLHEFRERRVTFVARVEAMAGDQLAMASLHPRLEQPMTVVDLCYFVAEHDDHHLGTIAALRASGD